ncbi:cobyrinate a,c-diamide synthase [Crassaminicella thermophila]|uniref:Cobyrinate a,c-diamide synthase n=1 Tax=Crassaminicella thermophila TaxID=2599308 RepID=A0A5C0SD44_CRATE|nr:cobyrinate a,c-diamide synthase [Crassaminicella thermophila]QEK11807.1 cobyrinate a,c-diamide synthase [Crassaminicella thermophila]
MKFPRFVLAGTQSGVGKTTISIGIMAAFKKRGLNVQPFKVGPDYIDPAFHSFVTKNKSRNLDSWMIKPNIIMSLFLKNSLCKDISIVEGVMGLYDGYGTKKDEGSTAHVSKIIQAPVILIVDGKGMSSSAAAQVLGYKLYDECVDIKGIIINNISGDSHYNLLKESIERDTKIKCVGYLRSNAHIALESRHLGLIPSVELKGLEKKIEEIAEMVEETIDLDALIMIANEAKSIEYQPPKVKEIVKNINIGVALDKSFNFYYEDNLDLLKDLGANLIYFSPIEDEDLPENLHGLYIGGGFPEVFAKELEKNIKMREKIKEAIKNGIPTYAECGGFMYLSKAITTLEDEKYEMVGIFDTEAKMTKRLQRFGYVHVNIEKPCAIAKEKNHVKAHEFHRSMIDENTQNEYVYVVDKIRNGEKIKTWKCGLKKYNALGAYAHIHFYSNTGIAKDFIENCMLYRDRSSEKNEK